MWGNSAKYESERFIAMKNLLTHIRNYFDRRLRERCVKYASRARQENGMGISEEAIRLYYFIKRGSNQ